LIEDYQALSKMVNALFLKLKYPIFFFLNTILTVLTPDPYSQYGSGSRGAISIQIHVDPDPDPKQWFYATRIKK